jgi:hypothetical protein
MVLYLRFSAAAFASEDSGTKLALLFDYSSLERMKTSD